MTEYLLTHLYSNSTFPPMTGYFLLLYFIEKWINLLCACRVLSLTTCNWWDSKQDHSLLLLILGMCMNHLWLSVHMITTTGTIYLHFWKNNSVLTHYPRSWYFFKGSSIQINWDFDNEITMYFIRSVKGYNSYYDEDGYYSSYTEGEVKARSGSRTYTVEKGIAIIHKL